jgi:hypothetical protein
MMSKREHVSTIYTLPFGMFAFDFSALIKCTAAAPFISWVPSWLLAIWKPETLSSSATPCDKI